MILLALGLSLPSGAASPTVQRRVGQASEVGAREVWWRSEWVRILEMSGSWAVESQPDFIVFVPEDPSCMLQLLAKSTGEVFQYRMQPEGRVAMAFGWIMIAVERRPDRLGRKAERMEPLPQPTGPQLRQIISELSGVEKIVVGGEGLFFEATPHGSNRLQAWCRVLPEDAGTNLIVQTVDGEARPFPSQEGTVMMRVSVGAAPPNNFEGGLLMIVEHGAPR